jgi:hypothetical protein
MASVPSFPKPRSGNARRWSRGLLAGPVAFVTAVAVMAGGALWVPKGAASIDNIVLPIVLFPAIWALLFFYACLDRRLPRAWAVTIALLLLNSGLIAIQFIGRGATP